ncbi:hypothetical protein SporoP37_01640 [Sporosarcina sp. P37]|uniref:GDYXXLXY domain-containing protein n=1 Tax=unclassified Sporosarcina TaxID=2647733 RepID=UPI0009C183D7|nr:MULTISPECIES: GDYXXLXY domain-containing protein [unclassified Sporosarcina]ARD46997.1 hypothetical protein SporoP33_01225 [Sporosarcina sp. P33]ARK23521.1 hypothetical protein SporoP37_01640 [Sporosarcina sp. P37]PID17677.1 hypothetical protein CSV62_12395 [Sporosarcina sp. P35]
MGPKHSKFSIAILFIVPLLILVSLTIPHFATIQSGADIYLQTEPITEQDTTENYVVLRYEVEKVPKERMTASLVTELKQPKELGQTRVFGILERKDGVDQLVSLTDKKPSEGLFLMGWLPQTTDREYRQNEHYMVNFGLDRFYVPKFGHRVSADSVNDRTMTAHFKVLDGHGVLREFETN